MFCDGEIKNIEMQFYSFLFLKKNHQDARKNKNLLIFAKYIRGFFIFSNEQKCRLEIVAFLYPQHKEFFVITKDRAGSVLLSFPLHCKLKDILEN